MNSKGTRIPSRAYFIYVAGYKNFGAFGNFLFSLEKLWVLAMDSAIETHSKCGNRRCYSSAV